MKCTKCGGKTRTVNTREYEQVRYRQHTCLSCGQKVYTVEQIADEEIVRKMLHAIERYSVKGK